MKVWHVSATLMVLFLVFAVFCDFIGDQTRAIYNMLWAIFLAVFLVGEQLREDTE
jgi:dolichyl-phosphate-mannose--protein O-mannosyl transferase